MAVWFKVIWIPRRMGVLTHLYRWTNSNDVERASEFEELLTFARKHDYYLWKSEVLKQLSQSSSSKAVVSDWRRRCPDTWVNIILAASMRMLLDKINIWIRLDTTGCPLNVDLFQHAKRLNGKKKLFLLADDLWFGSLVFSCLYFVPEPLPSVRVWMTSVPHNLSSLNTWSPVGGTLWGG